MTKTPLLSGDSTTVDWQVATTRLAILPIGAFEQHGGRLPLRTDALLAEHFAERLARELAGALLPVISYATSLEHTGFRGSISIRPETAMALLRDLIDCLEKQGFRQLIVVNGHGGNFYLGPVIREVNAQDRHIKVLIVDCGGPFDTSPEGRRLNEGELHAGASEISRLMAINEELVQPPSAALPLAGTTCSHFLRSDLNTFGVGVRDASGVWGDPHGGDPTSGQAMNDNIAANQLRHVRERLAWLDSQPGYAGAGGIALRPLIAADIIDGVRLCREAHWNQRQGDWQTLLDLHPQGGQVAVAMGSVVGTITTTIHEQRCGWIGMVLVDRTRRRMGIATRLMNAALKLLTSCEVIGLDATIAGKAVYDQLGFVDRYPLARLVRKPTAYCGAKPEWVRAMTAADLPAVAALDAKAFGFSRLPMLSRMLTNDATRAWVALEKATVIGFALGRAGENFDQIGPVIACTTAAAIGLVQTALSSCPGRTLGIDIFLHSDWQEWLAQQGFTEERRFMRMLKGTPTIEEQTDSLFAIAGPEFG